MCSETTDEQLLEAVLQVRKVILDSKSQHVYQLMTSLN